MSFKNLKTIQSKEILPGYTDQNVDKKGFPFLQEKTRFSRLNVSLASCSTAELASVSFQHCKILNEKLYLHTVKKSSHLLNLIIN